MKTLIRAPGEIIRRIEKATEHQRVRMFNSKIIFLCGSTKTSKRSRNWEGKQWLLKMTMIKRSTFSNRCCDRTISISVSKPIRCHLRWLRSPAGESPRTSCWWRTCWSKMQRTSNLTVRSNKELSNTALPSGVKRAHTSSNTSRINAYRASDSQMKSWLSNAATARLWSLKRVSHATQLSASSAPWSTIRWFSTATSQSSNAACAATRWWFIRWRMRTTRTKQSISAR